MEALDLALRTLFMEYQEAVLQRHALENSLKLHSLVKKKIKGKIYWYKQTYDADGRIKQAYYAPSTPALEKEIKKGREAIQAKRGLLSKLRKMEVKRTHVLKKGGLPALETPISQILDPLSKQEVVYHHGVLVGSLAFSGYVGLLGFLFDGQSLKTQDIDIVRDSTLLPQGIEPIQIASIFPNRGNLFSEIPSLNPKGLPSSFVHASGVRIDFLTPLRGAQRKSYASPGILQVGAEPLRFLDFLIADRLDTVLLGHKGGIPVTLPHPARFAVHKMIVSSRRDLAFGSKKQKDLLQASQLILACQEACPNELKQCLREAMQRGKKWKKALDDACQGLKGDARGIIKAIK